MRVICADPSPISLLGLNRRVSRILPESEVYLCKNTETAIRYAKKRGCDVLITEIDFGRNKGEGIQLVNRITAIEPNVNVIFLTSAPYMEYAALIMKMKYSGYLTKPYMDVELERELTNLRFRRNA